MHSLDLVVSFLRTFDFPGHRPCCWKTTKYKHLDTDKHRHRQKEAQWHWDTETRRQGDTKPHWHIGITTYRRRHTKTWIQRQRDIYWHAHGYTHKHIDTETQSIHACSPRTIEAPFILSAVKRPHTHLCCVIAIACDHIASPWVQQSYQLWPQLGTLSIAPSMPPSPYYPSCHMTPTVVMDLAVWIHEFSASFFYLHGHSVCAFFHIVAFCNSSIILTCLLSIISL